MVVVMVAGVKVMASSLPYFVGDNMRLKWWSILPSLLVIVGLHKYIQLVQKKDFQTFHLPWIWWHYKVSHHCGRQNDQVYTYVQSEKKHKDIFFYVHIKCFSYSWSFLKWWNGDAVPGDWHGFESSCIGLVLEGIGFGVDFPWPSSLGAVAAL